MNDALPTIPRLSDLYEASVRASREAWKNAGELAPAAPAPGVRHDASAQDAPAPGLLHHGETRVDVASIPKIADLYEASVRRSLSAWKNTGDKPERGGAR